MQKNAGDRVDSFQLFTELFPRLIHSVMHGYESEVGRRLGLNHSQVQTLVVLNRKTIFRMSDLCHKIHLKKSSVTSLVDSLEKLGYVLRKRPQDDRRAVVVRLTETGMTTAAACQKEIQARFAQKLSSLSDSEQQELWHSLDTINTIILKMEHIDA